MTKATKEVKKHQHIKATDKIDDAYELELIHVKGDTSTEKVLTDSELDYSVENAYCLMRTVEMFQWVEHAHTEKD